MVVGFFLLRWCYTEEIVSLEVLPVYMDSTIHRRYFVSECILGEHHIEIKVTWSSVPNKQVFLSGSQSKKCNVCYMIIIFDFSLEQYSYTGLTCIPISAIKT